MVTGEHSFDKKTERFEYKYCLLTENDYDEVEPFYEHYNGPNQNRTLNLKDFPTGFFSNLTV